MRGWLYHGMRLSVYAKGESANRRKGRQTGNAAGALSWAGQQSNGTARWAMRGGAETGDGRSYRAGVHWGRAIDRLYLGRKGFRGLRYRLAPHTLTHALN